MAHHATRSVFALLACAGTASAQVPTITSIGVLPGGAVSTSRGISGNGHVVVGNCLLFGANRSVVWSSGTPLLDLGLLPGHTSSDGNAASADGSVIVGADRAANLLFRAFRWSSPGPKQDLGMLPGQTTAQARDVSADGQVIVGDCGSRAFRWTSAGGMIDLGVVPGAATAIAYGTNSDGSVVVGASGGGSPGQAYRWTAGTGMVGLGMLPGGTSGSYAIAVSGDGDVVAGVSSTATFNHGFRWTEALGMEDLGQGVNPFAASDDGSVVAGAVSIGGLVTPFIWTRELGVTNLTTYLAGRGTNLTGWTTLGQVFGVSDDGSMLVGSGSFNGVTRGWVVNLDPDTDGDGLRDSWEMIGVPYKDENGVTHRYELPDADPMHKNLYVEVDAMTGFGLNPGAVPMVEGAFANSPVPNPVAPTGITLFIELDDDDLPHRAVWESDGCWPLDFDAFRTSFYGTEAERADPNAQALLEAKAKAYRYCIVADRCGPFRYGGCGARPGDNFVLFATTIGAVPDRHASAFMHELGHNLGLMHGGGDAANGKPNYPSIMNYPLAYKYHWARDFWRLDYSRAGSGELLTLNENSLDERFGIGIASGQYSNYSMPFGINILQGGATVRAHDYVRLNNARVDFANTAGTGFQDGFFDAGIRQDLNYLTQPPPGIRLPSTPSPGETLVPFNDWAIISLPLSTVRAGNAPAPSFADDELTEEAIAWIDQTFRDPVAVCYANCDGSTAAPILNVNDFICFQTRFAAGESYANCDGSTTPPVLNVNDFICFQTSFAAGCP